MNTLKMSTDAILRKKDVRKEYGNKVSWEDVQRKTKMSPDKDSYFEYVFVKNVFTLD